MSCVFVLGKNTRIRKPDVKEDGSMDVRPCRRCKRLFNYISGQPICPECRDILEKKFVVVKEYIRENPRATMQEISDDNEVPVSQLKQWVREERLSFSENSPVGLDCEKCGAMIRTGRYCANCKDKMTQTLRGLIKQKDDGIRISDWGDKKNRMRF